MKAKATDLSARGLGFEPRLCFFRGGRFFSFLPHFRTLFPLAMIPGFPPLIPLFLHREFDTGTHPTTHRFLHLPHDREFVSPTTRPSSLRHASLLVHSLAASEPEEGGGDGCPLRAAAALRCLPERRPLLAAAHARAARGDRLPAPRAHEAWARVKLPQVGDSKVGRA